jgi:hypothetical protein
MHAMRKRLVFLVVSAAVAAAAAIAFAQGNLATLFTLTPGEMKFVADSANPGFVSSVLVGDPSKAGVYAIRWT